MKVQFPQYDPRYGMSTGIPRHKQIHFYYNTHHTYILNILKTQCEVEMVNVEQLPKVNEVVVTTKIDDKIVAFDLSDFCNLSHIPNDVDVVFKLHYGVEHIDLKHVHSFSPITFLNWPEFYTLEKQLTYNPTINSPILNNQDPRAGAKERRTHVRNILRSEYGNTLDYSRTNQQEFFRKVSNCLVSVCVPGARNDMLDRGQGQYMFFGGCTISPRLVSCLSWNTPIIPNVHYIECADDYSDLIEKIEWCKTHLDECKQIGKNAKQLMFETSTPEKHMEWIRECI